MICELLGNTDKTFPSKQKKKVTLEKGIIRGHNGVISKWAECGHFSPISNPTSQKLGDKKQFGRQFDCIYRFKVEQNLMGEKYCPLSHCVKVREIHKEERIRHCLQSKLSAKFATNCFNFDFPSRQVFSNW